MRVWERMSIGTRLTALFTLLSLIPASIIGTVSLNVSSNALSKTGVEDSLTRLEFIAYRADEIITGWHEETLMTAFNPYVRALFDEDLGGVTQAASLVEDQAKRRLISLCNGRGAVSVRLIAADGRALEYKADSLAARMTRGGEKPDLNPARFRLFDAWGEGTLEDGERVIPYERVVLSRRDNTPVALLRELIRESLFGALFAPYAAARGTRYYIVDARGGVRSATDPTDFARTLADATGLDPARMDGASGCLPARDCYYIYYKDLPHGLCFLERIPASSFNAAFHPILRITLIVALLSFILCLALGAAMSRSFTRPLYALIDRVAAHDGLFPARYGGGNELKLLSDRYEQILSQLENAIGAYYDETEKKKQAQIRALEFQINPHFLYNTLSTIIWLIDAGEGTQAIRITKDLSQFFRISISKGRDYITIGEEIKHVELYVDIQMARYAGSITVSYDVPESLRQCLTPKLILQPLVENSIIHAMQGNASKCCQIRVSVAADGDAILLRVIDDGEKTTQQQIDAMNRFLTRREGADEHWGIGISNVHDRVQMCFGEGYGLRYARGDAQTIATIRIKKILPRKEADAL